MKVYIMRGLPGSGKSLWIAKNLTNRVICSADHYHETNGGYEFRRENVGKAHNACLEKFTLHLIDPGEGLENVVVDNTNTTAVEIAPYYRLAEALNHEVEIIHLRCHPETSFQRNIHNVPMETIWRMWQNLLTERLPPNWKESIL